GAIRGRKPYVLEGVCPSPAFGRLTWRCGKHHLSACEIDEHLFRFIACPVDQLVIGLVEVGEQAAIASANTGLSMATDEQLGVACRDRFIDILKMHQG